MPKCPYCNSASHVISLHEEYLDALEDAIEDECEYLLYEITPEGEEHWDEMEAGYESYKDYLKTS